MAVECHHLGAALTCANCECPAFALSLSQLRTPTLPPRAVSCPLLLVLSATCVLTPVCATSVAGEDVDGCVGCTGADSVLYDCVDEWMCAHLCREERATSLGKQAQRTGRIPTVA
jgi:hypothetical protein